MTATTTRHDTTGSATTTDVTPEPVLKWREAADLIFIHSGHVMLGAAAARVAAAIEERVRAKVAEDLRTANRHGLALTSVHVAADIALHGPRTTTT